MEKLDYAPHYLETKKQLNEIYQLLNNKEFRQAAGKIEFAISELRLMKAAVNSHLD
jgi:hypothetical protein